MIREKSCGAVIFLRRKNDAPLFLLETMQAGHVAMCKGHVEGNETEQETAAREIREETDLTVRFLPDFRETDEYSPYPDCVKQVVYFLAEADTDRVTPQECEVRSIAWCPYEEALSALTYESDRAILRAAWQRLNA